MALDPAPRSGSNEEVEEAEGPCESVETASGVSAAVGAMICSAITSFRGRLADSIHRQICRTLCQVPATTNYTDAEDALRMADRHGSGHGSAWGLD